MLTYTDQSPMPFGKFKGHRLANVPAKYLVYLWDEKKLQEGPLRTYVKDNLDNLRKEVELDKKQKRDRWK